MKTRLAAKILIRKLSRLSVPYKEREIVDSICQVLHMFWIDLSEKLISNNVVPAEIAKSWASYMIPYPFLPSDIKNRYATIWGARIYDEVKKYSERLSKEQKTKNVLALLNADSIKNIFLTSEASTLTKNKMRHYRDTIIKYALIKAGGKCYFCKEKVGPKDAYNLTWHHVDGKHDHNVPSNLEIAHSSCHKQYHSSDNKIWDHRIDIQAKKISKDLYSKLSTIARLLGKFKVLDFKVNKIQGKDKVKITLSVNSLLPVEKELGPDQLSITKKGKLRKEVVLYIMTKRPVKDVKVVVERVLNRLQKK